MESYNAQSWTVIGNGKYEKEMPESHQWESTHPHYTHSKTHGRKPESYYHVKPEYRRQCEESEWNKPEYKKYEEGQWTKPEYKKYEEGQWNKPEYKKYEETEYNKPEWTKKYEEGQWNKKYEIEGCKPYSGVYQTKPGQSQFGYEKVCGDWEKICENIERVNLDEELRGSSLEKRECCSGSDEETIKQIKELITILIGAEQSYVQLGFLCMDEKITLTNTAEYFRLCGLRLKWLSFGLMRRSVRLFNVNEWINTVRFENWFKVPSKEELATNDYTSIIKNLFKIVIDAEHRIYERMTVLGEKMAKTDCPVTECKFEGFKWFTTFVLPYQTRFMREITGQFRNIEMCDNGYVFDKCEMMPLVWKIEQFIHQIVKVNTTWPVKVMTLVPLGHPQY